MSSSYRKPHGPKLERHEEMQGTIEHLKTQQNWLMTTMERKHRMIKGLSAEIQSRFLKEVLVLEEKFTDAENCSRSTVGLRR